NGNGGNGNGNRHHGGGQARPDTLHKVGENAVSAFSGGPDVPPPDQLRYPGLAHLGTANRYLVPNASGSPNTLSTALLRDYQAASQRYGVPLSTLLSQ